MALLQSPSPVWQRIEIGLNAKLRVFSTPIRTVLLYGCRTKALSSKDIKGLDVFDHWCLGCMLKTNRRNRISNEAIRNRHQIARRAAHKPLRRLQWFSYVLCKRNQALTGIVLPPSSWRCRRVTRPKTELNTIFEVIIQLVLHQLYGIRQWYSKWVDISTELVAYCQAWTVAIRNPQRSRFVPFEEPATVK